MFVTWLLLTALIAAYLLTLKVKEPFDLFDEISDGVNTAIDAVEEEVVAPVASTVAQVVPSGSGDPAPVGPAPAGPAPAGPAPAGPAPVGPAIVVPPVKAGRVSFWIGQNFKGTRYDWTVGGHPKLKKGIYDTFSSVLVPPGYLVTVHSKMQYKGKKTQYAAGNYPTMGPGWNDKVKSLTVTKVA